MPALFRRIWYLLNRRRVEREMADEMAYHRDLMGPGERDTFGSNIRLFEDAREVWGWLWLDRVKQDIVYGARVLRKAPRFTLTAMLVLALGIGIPLTALRAVLLDIRGTGAPDPDSLVHLTRRAPGVFITNLPNPELTFYAANAQSFRALIGILDRAVGDFGDGEQVRLTFATANYFHEFGIVPLRGRVLNPADDRPEGEPAALVGELFWKNRLGADPAIVDRDIRVNGKLLHVVGVMPVSAPTGDVWLPLARQPDVIEGSDLRNDWASGLDVYGRLKPGVSVKAAEQETKALAARLHELRPNDVREGEYLEARPINQLQANGDELRIVVVTTTLVTMLLVAACANLGILMLARGASRGREIRTRIALGASRARVVRQLFTEALLLAALSAACALLLSSAVLKWIQIQHNPDAGILPDGSSIAATAFGAILAAMVFGLPTALRLTSPSPHGGRARTIFLTTQVAASCLLLLISGLMTSNLRSVLNANPGFDYRHLLWISPGLKSHGYSAASAQQYLDTVRLQAANVPGVRSVSSVWLAPWGKSHMGERWAGREFSGNRVDPEFLGTAAVQLLRGRNFRPGEDNVAILSRSSEQVLWPGGDAIGKTLPWDNQGTTVIGIARDASTAQIVTSRPLEFYLPRRRSEADTSVLLVRVSGDPQRAAKLLQGSARSLDKRLQPVAGVLSGEYEKQIENVARPLQTVSILGLVAILLSAIGLSGLAGYTVAQRTREIGVRIALGARSGQVVRGVLLPLWKPLTIGFTCGAFGGMAVASVLRGGLPQLAGMSLFDPLGYVLAIASFVLLVTLSVFAPVRRALRISPSRALHHE